MFYLNHQAVYCILLYCSYLLMVGLYVRTHLQSITNVYCYNFFASFLYAMVFCYLRVVNSLCFQI